MSHLEKYLKYYNALNEPGYAVLVKGEWGVGKTYQVKRAIEAGDRIYVSLFGINSVAALHSEVLGRSQPIMKKVAKFSFGAANTAKSIRKEAGALSAIPDALEVFMRWRLKKNTNKMIIFDDLERCSIKLSDSLGAISFYVEQLGFKVVVIAHDGEIEDELKQRKEKVFGQTLEVVPDEAKAYSAFANVLPDPKTRVFLAQSEDMIRGAFESSGCKSLRVLQHSVRDLARFHECLRTDIQEHEFVKTKLYPYFVALTIEVRANDLVKDDLIGRGAYRIKQNISDEATSAEKWAIGANKKYEDIDILESYLSDELLVDMLINGHFDKERLNVFLKHSPRLLPPADLQPWQKVLGFDEFDDAVVEEGRVALLKQIADRSEVGLGEMLHMFSMLLLMSSYGEIDESLEEVEVKCRQYMDELSRDEKIQPRDRVFHWKSSNPFSGSSHGYIYWVPTGCEDIFSRLKNDLMEKSEAALQVELQKEAPALLNLVRDDPLVFLRKVSSSSVGEGEYAYFAILHNIQPKQFVDAWLSGDRVGWRYVQTALEKRYEANNFNPHPLEPEWAWIMSVLSELKSRTDQLEGFSKSRVMRIVPKVL